MKTKQEEIQHKIFKMFNFLYIYILQFTLKMWGFLSINYILFFKTIRTSKLNAVNAFSAFYIINSQLLQQ